jgi:hypothetical protein
MAIQISGNTVIDNNRQFIPVTISAGSTVGTAGSVLISTGVGVAWTSPASSSVILTANTSADTTTYPLLVGDTTVGTGQTVCIDNTSLSYNASTNTLTSGNLSTGAVVSTSSTTGISSSTKIDLYGQYVQTVVAVSALNIDCSLGNYFTKTIAANSIFTVSNVPASRSYSFTLELTHTSGTVTWFSGVEWPGSVTPTLTTGKTHLFMFVTDDGGTRWRGSSLINYTN